MKAQKPKSKTSGELARIGRFSVVGILNTGIDLTIYNLLIHASLSPGYANIPSTTIAMVFSFFANRQAVFKSGSKQPGLQAAKFLAATAFGLYVIQSVIINILTKHWLWPGMTAYHIVSALGLAHVFSQTFVIDNSAKVLAIVASLVWNYLTYKNWVFKS